mmetsp:Transcript_46750/g.74827  ORF Transcript_46750/g.74827 Transcript_46750/m.74827 type:complete len:263 (-) Transcript_46750:550-1338(-)
MAPPSTQAATRKTSTLIARRARWTSAKRSWSTRKPHNLCRSPWASTQRSMVMKARTLQPKCIVLAIACMQDLSLLPASSTSRKEAPWIMCTSIPRWAYHRTCGSMSEPAHFRAMCRYSVMPCLPAAMAVPLHSRQLASVGTHYRRPLIRPCSPREIPQTRRLLPLHHLPPRRLSIRPQRSHRRLQPVIPRVIQPECPPKIPPKTRQRILRQIPLEIPPQSPQQIQLLILPLTQRRCPPPIRLKILMVWMHRKTPAPTLPISY